MKNLPNGGYIKMKRKKKMQQQDLTYDEKIALIKKINQKMREELELSATKEIRWSNGYKRKHCV